MKDEKQLLADLKAGKPAAVQQWFELYQPKLLHIAQSKLEAEYDAEEIVQETFINALRQLNLFRGESSLWTWMQSILHHEIADFYRKKYAKKALRTIPLADFLLHESDKTADDVSEKVLFILSKMRDVTQELLKQKYIDNKKTADIARYFGRSLKSIESDLYRARVEFRKLWQLEYGMIESGV